MERRCQCEHFPRCLEEDFDPNQCPKFMLIIEYINYKGECRRMEKEEKNVRELLRKRRMKKRVIEAIIRHINMKK